MKKILVTGGAGYIGSFIVRELERSSFEPFVVDDFGSGHKSAIFGTKFLKLDLSKDKEKLTALFKKEKFDAVIHMASFIQMGESFRDPGKYFRNNILSALNVLDAMVENGVPYIVFSSSAGVYGNPEVLPIKEDDPKNPLNPYGETKFMVERILASYDKAHGIKFAAIRYFNAAGAALDGSLGEDHPNESHLIPLVIRAAVSGTPFKIFGNDYNTPDGTCVRDYVHVLDLSRAHTLALKKLMSGAQSDFFNAGAGEGYSNKQIVEMVEKVTGKKIEIEYAERREGDADSLFASVEKIKKMLSWTPKFGLREIIESAYKWHRTHPGGYKE